MSNYKLICSNNITALKSMEANSIDACITDPPYGMEIAGVGWDHNVPPVDTWKEMNRVLKPGAFVL
jgi:DNA modification methylase